MDTDFTVKLLKTLPHLMHQLFHNVTHIEFSQTGEDVKLNKTQQKTLMILYSEKSLNMSTLCRILNMEKGSFTSVIDNLIRFELVERKRDDKDRRKVHINLTAAGRKLVKQRMDLISKQIEQKLAVLSDKDYNRFINAVEILEDITAKLGAK